jgi:hypothetical protein
MALRKFDRDVLVNALGDGRDLSAPLPSSERFGLQRSCPVESSFPLTNARP